MFWSSLSFFTWNIGEVLNSAELRSSDLVLSVSDGTSNCPGPTRREDLYPIIILPNRLRLGKVMFCKAAPFLFLFFCVLRTQ